MNAAALADVSVLIPTFNDPEMLRRHLERSRDWLAGCGEVLVVDSSESPECLDLAKQSLADHPGAQFLTHPPGLYASWNFGIREAGKRFAYISTLCDFIDQSGLEHLLGVAEEFSADLVISPPRFKGPEASANDTRWPLHELLENLEARKPFEMPPLLWLVTCLTGSTKTLMGSSASNLYSTKTMKKRPFPEDLGALGDSGWAARHGGACRIVITPEPCAEFCLHTSREYRSADWEQLTDRLSEYIQEGIFEFENGREAHTRDLARTVLTDGNRELTRQRRNFYELTGVYELNEELQHYNSESEKDRALKQELIDRLHGTIEEGQATIEKLSQELRTARAELGRLESLREVVRHGGQVLGRKAGNLFRKS